MRQPRGVSSAIVGLIASRWQHRQPEALVQIEQRTFHGGLKIQGLAFARLKNPMGTQTNLLRLLIPGDGDVAGK